MRLLFGIAFFFALAATIAGAAGAMTQNRTHRIRAKWVMACGYVACLLSFWAVL